MIRIQEILDLLRSTIRASANETLRLTGRKSDFFLDILSMPV